jgi:hypothetical protein
MMEIETKFSEEGKKAIREIIIKELEDISKRLSRLEHKVFHFTAIQSKKRSRVKKK